MQPDNPLGFPSATPTQQGSAPQNSPQQDNPLGFPTADPTASPPLDHSQSATVLSHSTGLMESLLSPAIGAAKGGLQTGMHIADMAAKAGSQIPGPVGQFMADRAQAGEQLMNSPEMQPQGFGQNVGAAAEHVGEFMSPAGIESSLAAKAAPHIEQIAPALGIVGKAASALTTGLKSALGGLLTGTSMAGVTGLQTGGDTGAMKQAGELGGVAGSLSGALESVAPGMLATIQKSGFKLSPTQEAKTTKIANNAANFMANNKILGSEESKFSQLQGVTSSMENALQSSLPDTQIMTKNVVAEINSTVNELERTDPAVYPQARTVADHAIKAAEAHGDSMSMQDALDAKRSWGSMAFKMASKGKVDPTVSNEGAFSAEQAFQKNLEVAMMNKDASINLPDKLQPLFGGAKQVSLPDFNKVYSDAINSKNLMGIARFKNDAHLFGRIFGLWAGRTAGAAMGLGPVGEIVSAGLGESLSNKLPSVVRRAGEMVASHPTLPATAAKVGQGITNSLEGQLQ